MARLTSQGVVDGGSTLPSGTAQRDLPPVEAWGESNLDQRPRNPSHRRENGALRYPAPRPSGQLIRATRCGLVLRRFSAIRSARIEVLVSTHCGPTVRPQKTTL